MIVAHITNKEILNHDSAQELGTEIANAVHAYRIKRLLLDFHKTTSLSSAAFAILLNVARVVAESDGRLAICGFQPAVRMGADFSGLGHVVPIFENERSALAVF